MLSLHMLPPPLVQVYMYNVPTSYMYMNLYTHNQPGRELQCTATNVTNIENMCTQCIYLCIVSSFLFPYICSETVHRGLSAHLLYFYHS